MQTIHRRYVVGLTRSVTALAVVGLVTVFPVLAMKDVALVLASVERAHGIGFTEGAAVGDLQSHFGHAATTAQPASELRVAGWTGATKLVQLRAHLQILERELEQDREVIQRLQSQHDAETDPEVKAGLKTKILEYERLVLRKAQVRQWVSEQIAKLETASNN